MHAMSIRRLRVDLEKERHPSGERDPFRPLTEEEEKVERATARRSTALTRSLVNAALAIPCAEHDAEAGESCWPTMRGICMTRIELGLPEWHGLNSLALGELEDFATATRRAQRDAKWRARHGWGG